jgi:hypothetical protein
LWKGWLRAGRWQIAVRRHVEAFQGATLIIAAAACLACPVGVLYCGACASGCADAFPVSHGLSGCLVSALE